MEVMDFTIETVFQCFQLPMSCHVARKFVVFKFGLLCILNILAGLCFRRTPTKQPEKAYDKTWDLIFGVEANSDS
jgi:hypothetical protein